MRPEEIPGMVRRAFQALGTGRPRPVEIEVPPDVLEQVADVILLEREDRDRSVDSPGDPDLLRHAAEVLGKAERPVIWSGGGVLSSGAWEELRALSSMLEAPVVMSSNGRGALSDREPRGLTGMLPSRELIAAADVMLVVGSRFFLNPRLGVTIPDGVTVIQVDIDSEQIRKSATSQIGIEADAKGALRQLVELVPQFNRTRESRDAELEAIKARAREMQSQTLELQAYALAIREELPDDGIVVSESTQVGYWSTGGGFPVYEPRTYVTSGYQGTLGYGYATALGAQVGNPDRKVVSITGDGGFMYNVQELSTQAQQGIPLVTVVFNDNGYGNVRRMQVHKYNDHRIATDLLNPDMVKMAESFGVAGYRASSPEELRTVLRDALASNAPALIDVPLPPAQDLGIFQFKQEDPRPVLGL